MSFRSLAVRLLLVALAIALILGISRNTNIGGQAAAQPSCGDSDGIDYLTLGEVSGVTVRQVGGQTLGFPYRHIDHCSGDGVTLIEHACDGISPIEHRYPCGNRCARGRCDRLAPNATNTTACADGQDNDGDGRRDYFRHYGPFISRTDPGCANASDSSETSDALPCDNGVDEPSDADVLADYRLVNGDPGCISVIDLSEVDGQCDDTLDNDDDLLIDYPVDPGCTAYNDTIEN